MSRLRRHRAWLLPLLVLLVALAVVAYLMLTREPPPAESDAPTGTVVETITVRSASHTLEVDVHGTVTPARQLVLQPQVSGRLAWVHPNVQPGGLVKAGETLFRIDDTDYALAVEQAQSQVAEASAQLRLERGRAEVAEEEWELFQGEVDQDASPALALREPQLESVRAQLEAAEAALEQARLDLSRTEVEAPFDALVVEEQASVGQLVGTQANVISLVATDHFWLQAAVSRNRLPYIDIPRYTAQTGARVRVDYQIGDQVLQRQGQVLHLLGSLSEEGRMARLLIRIDDPLGLEHQDNPAMPGLPLLLESFVQATIEGPTLNNLVELPRQALQANDRAYVVTPGKTLSVRELEIIWRRAKSVLVRKGLEDGDEVVTSPLAYAFDGMQVRLADEQGKAQATRGDADEGGSGG